MGKAVRYRLEYVLLKAVLTVFGLMPWKTASNAGGWIGRTVGPRLAASRKAIRHIRAAMPEKTEDEARAIMVGMWDNLGRVMAEYPHLATIAKETPTPVHAEELKAIDAAGTTILFLGSHLANWEVAPGVLLEHGIKMNAVYRRPNNPYTARILEACRTYGGQLRQFPKSKAGMLQMFKALKDGNHVAMLIDQKYNEGIDATFFGMTARTSTTFFDLAQRFDCPLYPGRVVRHEGTRFVLDMGERIPMHDAQGNIRDVADVIQDYHTVLERWVREHPEQWLWLHRRWRDIPKE